MAKIRFVPKEYVLEIHYALNLDAKGFNNKGNFEFLFSAVENFLSSSTESDLERLIRGTSIYLFYLAAGHCFNDGNKRTAFLSATAFLMLNSHATNYNEDKIERYLKTVNEKLAKGARISLVLEELKTEIGSTSEFKMIKLLFDLAGAPGKRVYSSVREIVPIVSQLVTVSELPVSKSSWISWIKSLLEKLKQ